MSKMTIAMMLLFIACPFAQAVPPEVLDVVKEELSGKNFLSSFDSSKKKSIGFKTSTKLSDVKAGVPIQILRINWKLLETAKDSSPVSSIVESPEAWFVPLLENGEAITFLTITKKEGKWKAIGLGPDGLCCGWKKVMKYWPRTKYHAKIIGAGLEDYFNIIEEGDYNLTKFISYPCPNEICDNKEYIKNNRLPNYKRLTPSSISIRVLKKLHTGN